MKSILTALFALIIPALAVDAQSPPPPVLTAAEQSTTLTREERAQAVDYLKETRKEFTDAVKGLSEAQWKFKAAPDRWSIAETAEHIALAEETVWGLVSGRMMKAPATPEKRAEVKGKDEIILKSIPDRSRKAEAPERLKPTGKWATQAALVKDFESVREKEMAYLNETKEDLRSHFEEHPFLKTLDAYQWLLLNGAHTKRHVAQILEGKSEPKFPKN